MQVLVLFGYGCRASHQASGQERLTHDLPSGHKELDPRPPEVHEHEPLVAHWEANCDELLAVLWAMRGQFVKARAMLAEGRALREDLGVRGPGWAMANAVGPTDSFCSG